MRLPVLIGKNILWSPLNIILDFSFDHSVHMDNAVEADVMLSNQLEVTFNPSTSGGVPAIASKVQVSLTALCTWTQMS